MHAHFLRPLTALFCTAILAISSASGGVVTATFNAATDIPVSSTSYIASGNTVEFTLNFAPVAGTNLTVLNNTGLPFTQGSFDNLPQGQPVSLTYGGVSYGFVANYFGGTGNDLVLHWANVRLLGWGGNSNGGVGDGTTTNRSVPVPVISGPLAGKTVVKLAAGRWSSLALASDGTLAGWGATPGNNTDSSPQPVLVRRTGVLAGKTVVAISSKADHQLVLCSDGTIAGWGANSAGQLGNASTSYSSSPGAVSQTGVLAGKTVVAVAAGFSHSLALCSDGTVAAWGSNNYGELGNGTTTQSSVPVLVTRTGVLRDKTVSRIDAGGSFSLVLCTDGTLVSWGYNSEGELGNGSTAQSTVPVLVTRTGVLAGKTVTSIVAGGAASLALCSDGTLATWGHNGSGQLGIGTTAQSTVPVLVSRTGILAGKKVTAITAGNAHAAALCSDGTLAAWGSNFLVSLGNNSSTNSNVPVAVNTGALGSGEKFSGIESGFVHNIALAAAPPASLATTLAASQVRNSTATLNGSVNPNGTPTSLAFEYGTTTSYGSTATATPASVSGNSSTAVTADLSDLVPGATYHFRIIGTSATGTTKGENMTFTTGTNAVLASLTVNQEALNPAFSGAVSRYELVLPSTVESVRFTPLAADAAATVRVGGTVVPRGTASEALPISVGTQLVLIQVAAADGINSNTYSVTVIRRPETITFTRASDVPLTVDGLQASGPIQFSLDFAPPIGTGLTVVNNRGMGFIQGSFTNLTHGQRVDLTYGGLVYSFVANYFGGTGNDLVLEWANRRMLAWGYNTNGELGNNTSETRLKPAPSTLTGLPIGTTILGISPGGNHTLAYSADGTVASWGDNTNGQLGRKSTGTGKLPMTVDMTGVLAGKKVVSVAAGYSHSLALSSDGKIASWGENYRGELGNKNSSFGATIPISVDTTGILAGKSVVAIAAGYHASLALCADGTLATWGYAGMLGNNAAQNSSVPVAVDMSGVLIGKKVVAISAGFSHCLVLCSDGTLATWGSNESSQLGAPTTYATVPVLVDQSGVLAGKSVIAIATGSYSNLVQCADGTLVTWGSNNTGQLGNGTTVTSPVPVLVSKTGALAGKEVARVAAGSQHCLVLCTDGTMAAWGSNGGGQLGNNTSINSSLPVAVISDAFGSGENVLAVEGGSGSSFALTALPGLPLAVTLAASAVTDTGATLTASINANGGATTVSFEYGTTTAYGKNVAAIPASVSGNSSTAVSAPLAGLISGVTYHYRVIVTGAGGTVTGEDVSFTTTTAANLAGLVISGTSLATDFSPSVQGYAAAVASGTESITLTAVTALPSSTVRVNGIAVASGTASEPITLNIGENLIDIAVTADGGINTMNYQVKVTRMPATLAFDSASSVPVVVGDFIPVGEANFALNFAPTPGTILTVVRNNGYNLIRGTFSNLTQGQRVNLTFGNTSYAFVANYFGGSGNDLVLQWANTRVLTWGSGPRIPTAVDASGVLSGKTITAIASGSSHNLALCSDGTLAAWGYNGNGELGNGTTTDSTTPVLVSRAGVLGGKTIVAISAAYAQNVVLCSDGTIATWGRGFEGQLGNGSTTTSILPVLVNRSGVLAGKTVTAVSSGELYNLALCSDGTVASWGSNQYGKLGIGSLTNSSVPVLVDRSGALFDRRVIAISAGGNHAVALCEDGAVATWGNSGSAQLGHGSYADSSVPVLVDRSGVLAGKSIVEIVGGGYHSLLRCADGTLAAWGSNDRGQKGNNSTSSSAVPTLVLQSGVLAGKTVTAVEAGSFHSLALCSDGTMTSWGYNSEGQLGNNSTSQSTVPVLVNTSALRSGERAISLSAGTYYSLALVASPLQAATTAVATGITGTSAVLHGSVSANNNGVVTSFEYGLDTRYGSSISGSPSSASGASTTSVDAILVGLLPGTTYHYRLTATGIGGVARGMDMEFTTLSDNANLTSLGLGTGSLVPAFETPVINYIATVPFSTDRITLSPQTAHPGARVRVNGIAVSQGGVSGENALQVGSNTISALVTAEDGITTKIYTIVINRLPNTFNFASATDIPISSDEFSTGGYPVEISLSYQPVPGTVLTMVDNTGLAFITGTFANLSQGQLVTLSFGGKSYAFVANYFGGSGNDLVLQWATTKLLAWGSNTYGQLGNQTTTGQFQPGAVEASGILAGKTITAVAEGYLHSLALCSDGSLASWGYNVYGQLGNGSTAVSMVPAAVDQSGALAGKTVVAISAGPFHNLALCSDGTIAAWGYNNFGQLGTADKVSRSIPVQVARVGALAGKQVVGIAAGAYQSFARCSDGTVVAWGYNDEGELGDRSTITRSLPVAVDTSGALAGKKVSAISAGQYHTLALCTDGTMVAWGYNAHGELGNNTTVSSSVPVTVSLPGKVVTSIAAGASHSLARCADGTLVTWGANAAGQLGTGNTNSSLIPVEVAVSGGQSITRVATGGNHSLALLANGELAAWGENTSGQLGIGSNGNSITPVLVNRSGLDGSLFMFLGSSSASQHTLAVVANSAASAQGHSSALAAGHSGPLEDLDHDGIPNLIETAFGLDPLRSGDGELPQWKIVGNHYVVRFTEPAGIVGVTYRAETSADLSPDSWIEVPDTGSGIDHIFSVPVDGRPTVFVRLKVIQP